MDNYPKINLRKILRRVDFGTFYGVAKSRPEVFEVLTSYEFDEFQAEEIIKAFADGLTIEQIKSCATSEFKSAQMNRIYAGYKSGLTVEQMTVALNPYFNCLQLAWVIQGIQAGMEEKKLKLYAKIEFYSEKMEQIYCAIQNGLSIMKLRLIANPKFDESQMRILRMAFTSFESELEYNQVKVIADDNLSVEQMETLLNAYNYGLTIEQVKTIAKEEYSPAQMQEIIEAYADGYTDEEMALILNPKLDGEQMAQIHIALENSLTNAEIAPFAISEYESEHMEIIIEAYNYGNKAYVDLLLNPKFDIRQIETIWEICKAGILSIEEIKFLADPKNNWLKMAELARWFMDDFSIEQVQEYADKFDNGQLEQIRYGLKNKVDFMDLWVKPEFDEFQMKEAICGIGKGFTKEQLLVYLKSELRALDMEKVREDIEVGIPIERVMIYANCCSEEFEKTRIRVLYEEVCKLIK